MIKCVCCEKEAEKKLKIGDKNLYFCDDCASTLLVDISKQFEQKGMVTIIKFEGTDRGVIIGKNTCNRCNHTWTQRTLEIPIICPKCKSPYWNKEKKYK